MAIDLFCYFSVDREIVDVGRDELVRDCGRLFSSVFVISPAKDVDSMLAEVADEFGFSAKSFCMVSLNIKESANLIGFASKSLKDKFGENILILQENEHKL